MKCEKCNNHDANFYYKSTINGETTERHLCIECANSEGFSTTFSRPQSMFDEFFREPFGMFDGYFGGRPALPGYSPFVRVPTSPPVSIPRIEIVIGDQTPGEPEKSEAFIPQDAGEEVKAKRELSALKHQLKSAVKSENYEKCIELRDQICRLEEKV